MRKTQTTAEKIRALPWALSGDATNAIFVNLAFAGPVFLLFLDKLDLDKKQIGLVLSIVPFSSLVAMWLAPATAWVGFKRTYLICMTCRKLVWLMLIATPWVFATRGQLSAFAYVVVVVLVFSLFRAVGFLAFGPWVQEFVPNRVRGKFSAAQNVVFVVLSASTLAAAGRFLGDKPEFHQFKILFGVAIFVGLVSVVLYSRVPGGGSTRGDSQQRSNFGSMWSALRDRQFLCFLAAGALVTLGWAPLSMGAFLPLYLKDEIGLEPDQLLYFNATLFGSGAVSCFIWGWAADRYGSKPVLLLTVAGFWFYPLGLWLLPAHSALSFVTAMALAVYVGLLIPGWSVTYSRLLYVKLIPLDQRSGYAAVHQASVGVMAGVAPLIAGRVLESTSSLHVSLGLLEIGPYTPLMWSGLVLMGLAIFVLSRLASDGEMPVTRFAGMFMQGNALAAMQALIAYRLGGVEGRRVSTIERLGKTRSPLSVDELIEGLSDPSFNVRFEAVVSIARTRPDPKLTEAMIKVLRGGEPDMSIAAAWALGRLEDQAAIEPLRDALESEYPLLRARAARALGTIGDTATENRLLACFHEEPDPGIKLAYASALGALNSTAAIDPLLELLDILEDNLQRGELTLAVAAIVGRDDWFVKLARRVEHNAGDTLGGVLLSMRRRLIRSTEQNAELADLIDDCVRAFGDQDLDQGIERLRKITPLVPQEQLIPLAAKVLRHASDRMERFGSQRVEFAMLCMHILHTGFGAASGLPER